MAMEFLFGMTKKFLEMDLKIVKHEFCYKYFTAIKKIYM